LSTAPGADGSGERIGGIERIGMLAGRSVNVLDYLLDAVPLLESAGGHCQQIFF